MHLAQAVRDQLTSVRAAFPPRQVGRRSACTRTTTSSRLGTGRDSGNWAVGEPAFTTTLRGLADCVVEVRTLRHAVHSGAYGGVAPDALTALCRLLATLDDDQGNVAIEGLHAGPGPELVYPPERLRAESGVLEGVDYLGTGSVVERLWSRPAVAMIALDTQVQRLVDPCGRESGSPTAVTRIAAWLRGRLRGRGLVLAGPGCSGPREDTQRVGAGARLKLSSGSISLCPL